MGAYVWGTESARVLAEYTVSCPLWAPQAHADESLHYLAVLPVPQDPQSLVTSIVGLCFLAPPPPPQPHSDLLNMEHVSLIFSAVTIYGQQGAPQTNAWFEW